jgi:hypothetical protein
MEAVGEIKDNSHLLFVFDLDETLVETRGQIVPIPEAVEFLRHVISECQAYGKEYIFTILTANPNLDDIHRKIAVIQETLPEFVVPGIIRRPTTTDSTEKTYQHILKLYKVLYGTIQIPYPTFFFDNLQEQVDSVHRTAANYMTRRHAPIYVRTFHINEADKGTSWRHAQEAVDQVIQEPLEWPLSIPDIANNVPSVSVPPTTNHTSHSSEWDFEIPDENQPFIPKGGRRLRKTRRMRKMRRMQKTRIMQKK